MDPNTRVRVDNPQNELGEANSRTFFDSSRQLCRSQNVCSPPPLSKNPHVHWRLINISNLWIPCHNNFLEWHKHSKVLLAVKKNIWGRKRQRKVWVRKHFHIVQHRVSADGDVQFSNWWWVESFLMKFILPFLLIFGNFSLQSNNSYSPVEKLPPSEASIAISQCTRKLKANISLIGIVSVGNRSTVANPTDNNTTRFGNYFRKLSRLKTFRCFWQERQWVFWRMKIYSKIANFSLCQVSLNFQIFLTPQRVRFWAPSRCFLRVAAAIVS